MKEMGTPQEHQVQVAYVALVEACRRTFGCHEVKADKKILFSWLCPSLAPTHVTALACNG